MEELLERAASVLNCSSFDTDRALAAEIRALKKADPQPQVDATVESDAPQGGQGGYKAVGSAPRNIEGPAHLCPKPAPGFELDKRGVLVATDRGPSAPCVAVPSKDEVVNTVFVAFGAGSPAARALLFTRWKDGIDVEYPTSELMDFVRRICERNGA